MIHGGRLMSNNTKDVNFDKTAINYDNVGGKLSRKFYRLLIEQVDISPDMAVLDAGCGTGSILRRLADSCSIRGYGIDMSENMVEAAKQKCPEMEIHVSRCDDTKFEDNTFDVVTSCMAYHHFSNKPGFAKETARILKPGGHLYIADPNFPVILRKSINAIARVLNIAGEFFTPEEMYANFAACGFEPAGYKKDSYAQVVKLKLSDQ